MLDEESFVGHLWPVLYAPAITATTLALSKVPQWWFVGGPYVTFHRMRLRDMSYTEFRRKRRRK